jgi:threonine/homoserine/homoserine lactone efflux protein
MLDYCYFAFLMLLGQLSPGPDMLLVLKNSLNHDLRAALFTIAGITAGIIIHTTIALTGLSFLFAESASAYQILRYGGAAYLACLGSRLLLSLRGGPGSPRLENNATNPSISDRAAFVEGFATNILNPKIIIIISSVLLIFLGAESTLSQRLSYGILLVAEGIIVWIFIALVLQTRQAKNQFLRWQRPINATFGLLLLALAIRTII